MKTNRFSFLTFAAAFLMILTASVSAQTFPTATASVGNLFSNKDFALYGNDLPVLLRDAALKAGVNPDRVIYFSNVENWLSRSTTGESVRRQINNGSIHTGSVSQGGFIHFLGSPSVAAEISAYNSDRLTYGSIAVVYAAYMKGARAIAQGKSRTEMISAELVFLQNHESEMPEVMANLVISDAKQRLAMAKKDELTFAQK